MVVTPVTSLNITSIYISAAKSVQNAAKNDEIELELGQNLNQTEEVIFWFYLNIQMTTASEPQNLQKVNLQKEFIQKLKLQKIKYTET